MKKGKIIFKGNFWDFALKFIGLLVLTVITVGLVAPYLVFWQYKYFVDNLEIEIEE